MVEEANGRKFKHGLTYDLRAHLRHVHSASWAVPFLGDKRRHEEAL